MELDDIKGAILENRAIVFLGNGLSVNYGNPQREQNFFQKLFEENRSDVSAYHADDNFLIFNSKKAKNKIRRKAKPFYEQDFSSDILHKLAQIPFHTLICLSPDMALIQMFRSQRFRFVHQFCDGKTATSSEQAFSGGTPFVYHLFGCTEDPESLIVSHYDLFEYIKFIHSDGNQLQKVFGNTFDKDAYDYIIFLGCDFDKWYFQLVLNLLNIGFEYNDYEAFAVNSENKSNQWKTIYEQYFKVEFVEQNKIEDFVNQLHSCFKPNELRQASADTMIGKCDKTKIFKLLMEGFDDTGLRLMCQLDPDFEKEYNNFTDGQSKSQRIEKIIDHAERFLLFGKLLGLAKETNPNKYHELAPYCDDEK